MTLPLLSILVFLPLSGLVFISLVHSNDERNAKSMALWISILTFAMACVVWANFDPFVAEYQLVENYMWIESYNVHYHLGVDGLSLFFILLTTLLTPLCILASWHSIEKRVREYMMAFLLLETLLLAMFCAIDMFLFYVFFESVLIPLFLIIGIWGGANKTYACFKFFLYTLFGSLFMLLALVKLYQEGGTTHMVELLTLNLVPAHQKWLFLCFFLAFAVKIPMWPVHTWLPDAHVEAPTGGSVMLAGVLLKMGGYGLLRFCLPLLPNACVYFSPYVYGLSLAAIIFGSLIALVQTDMKKLVAYSSVAHMGFVTLGLFTFNLQGMAGGIVQMLSHGLVSAALFLCVGMLYERFHTRDITNYGGLMKTMPAFSAFFLFFIFANIGLPLTSGFIGEFYVLVGIFSVSTVVASFAVLGNILGAAYSLWLYNRLCFGKTSSFLETQKNMYDLDKREKFILSLLAFFVLWMGIYPKTFTDPINRFSRHVLDVYGPQKAGVS
jgi:NADH-quinone oxidoreductase subunit M